MLKDNSFNIKPNVFAINEEFVGIGQDNGIVTLNSNSKKLDNVRSFKNIDVSISFLNLNNDYLLFGSKWKNNCLRIFDINRKSLGNTFYIFNKKKIINFYI